MKTMKTVIWLLFLLLRNSKALFTVEMSPYYLAELHENVTMECRFPPGDGKAALSVFWDRLSPPPRLEVYKMVDGRNDINSQDPQFRGRVRLQDDELTKGRALLQISDVKINDSGQYQCLVEMGAGDYKQTTLTVQASYRNITATALQGCSLSPTPLLLQCQAAGFPKARVQWTDTSNSALPASRTNTSHTMTQDGLYIVTAQVKVNASCGEMYNCSYITKHNVTSALIYLSAASRTLSRNISTLSVILMLGGALLGMALCVSLGLLFKKRGFGRLQGYMESTEEGSKEVELQRL
ncbi:programmed cell death 1 ligand 1-like isoform X2 [Brienomyrus brachyistius]|uniref:programmed cell death 1 ligand 1-like isoform X2 n=1 Tax=Brienomyrus brachyistius TaxID=42636 RepID=UPI0020B2EAEA|nr:programmed cell death 1 ligand 1-like isoform X2 [Brienomyrus brachyistius]